MFLLLNVMCVTLTFLRKRVPQNADGRLCRMAEDALMMLRIADDIRLVEACNRKRDCVTGNVPGVELFTEHTLFHAAYRLGACQFDGLATRWPAWLITWLDDRGAQAGSTLWRSGVELGYQETLNGFPDID